MRQYHMIALENLFKQYVKYVKPIYVIENNELPEKKVGKKTIKMTIIPYLAQIMSQTKAITQDIGNSFQCTIATRLMLYY